MYGSPSATLSPAQEPPLAAIVEDGVSLRA